MTPPVPHTPQHAAEDAPGHPEAIRSDAAHVRCHADLSTEQAVRMWAVDYVFGRVVLGKGRENDLFDYAEKLVAFVMKRVDASAPSAGDAV